jgi:4-amino-4-deoxy-L-arabinose transferase-like glycosyltransferase
VAVLSGLFFALLPYSIYYSRVILPEPFMLLTSTAAIYFLAATTNLKKPVPSWQWWLSALLFSLALLIKPFIAFLIPVLLVFWWQTGPRRRWSPWWLVYWSVVILPIWWWRDWILQFPSGIPASDWLFNGNGIRFRPAWFRWLFYERLSKLMLGFGGVFLVTAGMILSSRRAKNLLWTWWASLLAYLSVFATGNVQHDYYQVIFVPWLSFCLGIGTWHTWRQLQLRLRGTRLIIGQVALVLLMLVGWLFSWQQVAGWFNVNHWEYQRAGQAVDQLTPPDAKVIAPAFGDTQFLFQTNRTGWPIGFTIDEKIAQGATYYVTTSLDDEAHSLLKIYALVYRTDEFLILDLENKLP